MKVPCKLCAVEIMAFTAEQNNGVCMKCLRQQDAQIFLTREKELRSNLPKYEPEIIHKDNATIQSFTASEIHFENTEDEDGESLLEVFLSDLADDGQTNIHCLILNIQDSETVYSEWNDQRNARWSEHIKNVELINDCLSLSFKEGREVHSGRISYSADCDIFNIDNSSVMINIIEVKLNIIGPELEKLKKALTNKD